MSSIGSIPKCRVCILVLCVALGLCCIGPGELTGAGADHRTVTVSDENNGETIRLTKGDLLVVRLEAQFGVGYLWQIAKNRSSRLSLQGKSEQETPQGSGPNPVEHQVFRFRARAAGVSILELHYLHPWEKGIAPEKIYRITVRIN